jgi:predicted RNA binding protein YcfA (HicA-like mRNA interferase family)
VKLPRAVDADQLIRFLECLGYQMIRQTGSHVRLTHDGPPQHHVTVPNHAPLKIGVLGAILKDVSRHTGMALEHLLERL